MSLDGAITNLASWAGNVMMPTMAGGFFAAAVYRFTKGGSSSSCYTAVSHR